MMAGATSTLALIAAGASAASSVFARTRKPPKAPASPAAPAPPKGTDPTELERRLAALGGASARLPGSPDGRASTFLAPITGPGAPPAATYATGTPPAGRKTLLGL